MLNLRGFGLCTLPSSEPRTSARSETWSGSALPKVQARPIFLKCYIFQHFYRRRGPGTRFFTKSLKRRAPTAVARLVLVQMVASDTQEHSRSTFWGHVYFGALTRLDFNRSGVGRLNNFPIRFCYLENTRFLPRWKARF